MMKISIPMRMEFPDWYEWHEFGNLDLNGSSDPDGDGFNIGDERRLGLSSVIVDTINEGKHFHQAVPVPPPFFAILMIPRTQTRMVGLIIRKFNSVPILKTPTPMGMDTRITPR